MLKTRACAHRRRLRRRVGLRVGLLIIPALFWSAVFATLSGMRTLESVVERAPDPSQILIAVTCPLLALIIGMDAIRNVRGRGADRISAASGSGRVILPQEGVVYESAPARLQ